MDHQEQRHASGIEAVGAVTPAVALPRLANNKRSRGGGGGGGGQRTVNDDEVDEFFEILKRLKEVKRLKNSSAIVTAAGNDDGDTRSRQCRAITWQPVFTLDDFKDVSGGKDRIRRCNDNTGNVRDDVDDDGNEVASRSFDLNVEPEVDRSDELLIS